MVGPPSSIFPTSYEGTRPVVRKEKRRQLQGRRLKKILSWIAIPGEAAIRVAADPGITGTGKATKARKALTAGMTAKAGNKAHA